MGISICTRSEYDVRGMLKDECDGIIASADFIEHSVKGEQSDYSAPPEALLTAVVALRAVRREMGRICDALEEAAMNAAAARADE